MKKKKIKASQYVLLIILSIFALMCLLPVLLVLVASFSSPASLASKGFSFFPDEWTLDAWKYIFTMGNQLPISYGVTIFATVTGTLGSLLVQSLLAYPLSKKTFKLRGVLSIMLLITMLFSGGQLAGYLVNTQLYHLKDKLLVLCIPSVGAMNVIIMRTYIQSNISDSLFESAKLDGAGEFRIYWQICLPLMKPVLASLGFMMANGIWNDWMTGYMYISSPNKTPLQLLLMRIENNINLISSGRVSAQAAAALSGQIPAESTRMALLFVVLGPIMIAYPFFQKYFVKGLTVGSVKG